MKDGRGWHGESGRHSLASRGIQTRSTVLLSPGHLRDVYERRRIRERMSWAADDYIRTRYNRFHRLTIDKEIPMGSDFVNWFIDESYLDIDSMKEPLNDVNDRVVSDLQGNQQNLAIMRNAVLLEMINLHIIRYDDAVELGYTNE